MKHFYHKSAFTMIELVFVIVVAGIIAVIALPRFDRNNLQEAADQVMNHLRYTQHLAMQDDKFSPNDANWHKKRWQLIFTQENESENLFSYTIFSDTAGTSSGNPDDGEIAKNPLDPTKLLTGGANGVETTDKRATQKMNLGKAYGITNVKLSTPCSISSSRRIVFDYLGRPLRGNPSSYSSSYPNNRLINSTCEITLETKNGKGISITIEPETGFVKLKN
ncbi:MAG: type II secretion system protein [Campylobacteraceae bacterium]|nr:type II secretion system protein [Campylobacteraceae bacterium]